MSTFNLFLKKNWKKIIKKFLKLRNKFWNVEHIPDHEWCKFHVSALHNKPFKNAEKKWDLVRPFSVTAVSRRFRMSGLGRHQVVRWWIPCENGRRLAISGVDNPPMTRTVWPPDDAKRKFPRKVTRHPSPEIDRWIRQYAN